MASMNYQNLLERYESSGRSRSKEISDKKITFNSHTIEPDFMGREAPKVAVFRGTTDVRPRKSSDPQPKYSVQGEKPGFSR